MKEVDKKLIDADALARVTAGIVQYRPTMATRARIILRALGGNAPVCRNRLARWGEIKSPRGIAPKMKGIHSPMRIVSFLRLVSLQALLQTRNVPLSPSHSTSRKTLTLCYVPPAMRAHQRLSPIRKMPYLTRESKSYFNQNAFFPALFRFP